MDEDREGLETVEKGRGIEQAGPRVFRVGRCGVSGQYPLTRGAAKTAGSLPREADSSHPTLQGGQSEVASQQGSGSHSASVGSGTLDSLPLKEVSDLRKGIGFWVLFPPKEKLICSRMDLGEKLGRTCLERCTFLS